MIEDTTKSFSQQVKAPFVNVFNNPHLSAGLESQLLLGETVRLIPLEGEWAKVVTLPAYNWYVKLGQFGDPDRTTHRVRVPQTLVYREPTFKSQTIGTLSMNAFPNIWSFSVTPEGVMGVIHGFGWVFMDHLAKVGEHEKDFVEVFRSLIGTPYEWGGLHHTKDCSSALKVSVEAAGGQCERDVIPQSKTFGVPFDLEKMNLRRGVAVFWTEDKGRHVAVMVDDTNCVHATIKEGIRGVVEQSLEQVIKDQEEDGNGRPTIYRYFPMYQHRRRA